MRLDQLQGATWKKLLNVQLPYRWCLRRLKPGFTLEIGCGIGRNLSHLNENAIGVDHNKLAISIARSRGFEAYEPHEFAERFLDKKGTFDSLLLSHILEHLSWEDARGLITEYLPWLNKQARIISITPGSKGFDSDPTHVTFFDLEQTSLLMRECGLRIERTFCFPFPRFAGKYFKHNEHVVVARMGD